MPASARALVVSALAAGTASAESKHVDTQPPRPWTGYIRTPGAARATPTTSSVTSSKIVYVKRCDANCEVFFAPDDDSRTGASSIAAQGGVRMLGDFKQPIAVWNEMMACVRETFAPFDITITETRPANNAPHFLHLVGGKVADVNPSPDLANAGGIAPFDCGEIPNAISYTFDVYGPDPLQLCWTVSQEVAHAFGLDHEYLPKDPMTYLPGELPKRFRDVDASCGELSARSCSCPRTSQNSYRHIVGMFGPGAPTPPDVTITHPKEGKPTQPGFTAVVKALDDVRVEKVELYIDGALAATTMTPIGESFELPTPDVGDGPHTLEIRAIDVQGVAGTASLDFTQGPPCTPDSVCTGADVCVSGICIPGPGVPGGLGATCQSDSECLSHRCVDGGEQFKHCVEECDLGNAASCPDEFTCLAAGESGVCWPSPSSGCCDAGTGPQGPILLTLGVLLLRRRRARA